MGRPALAWEEIFRRLRTVAALHPTPSVTAVADDGRNPFRILISTLISLRTRDEVTIEASRRLFAEADTPADLAELAESRIAELIHPAGFFRRKAATLKRVSQILVDSCDGSVPAAVDELTRLPGVGRKTATLTAGLAFGIPAICVDTHVHRIPNRLGWIATGTPDESEQALMGILPRRYWIELNTLLVAFGREICTPVSPRCGSCPLRDDCDRIGVVRSRE